MTISIIIPCYATTQNNHGALVRRAVHSALQQQVPKEVIVVDDGSPEPVENVWGNPVRVIRHSCNGGLSNALNTGILHSSGDRFIILASDDELRSDCLAKLSQLDADVVCSDFQGDAGGPIRCKPADLHTLINVGNCHSYAALIRRTAWDKTGGFKPAMNPSWEDYEMFISLAKTGATWAHVPEPLHLYHRNPQGRDVDAQDKTRLLQGKLHGYHPDLFGWGKGLVTFIIPCYAQEQWLGEALYSIKQQIYPHVNAVVVDDGSPGKVLAAVKAADCGEVHLLRQHNKHLAGARNAGIRYALQTFNSEYLVMLDADDAVAPEFVEELMAALPAGRNLYAYSDITFIGDAWHNYNVHDYDCQKLAKQHLHQCTFLAPAQLYLDVGKRGYMYDEAMRKGYEDWEFALATLKAGWCGLHYRKHLFKYRQHVNGSMRTQASHLNNELYAYIKSKHPWVRNQEAMTMACSTCGGRASRTVAVANKSGGVTLLVNIPGIGQIDAREPILVTYNGTNTAVGTKIGAGGTMYKYSAVDHPMTDGRIIGRKFTAYGRDAHLFVGPFTIERVQPAAIAAQPVAPAPVAPVAPAPVAPQPMAKPIEPTKPVEVARLEQKFAAREQVVAVRSFDPDDFTKLAGVTSEMNTKLHDSGFTYLTDLADATADEVAQVLKISKKKAQALVDAAKK